MNESRAETGEIKEYGLGRNWYGRTTAMFENLYGTIEETIEETVTRTVETVQRSYEAVQGYWQERVGGKRDGQPQNWQELVGKQTEEPERG